MAHRHPSPQLPPRLIEAIRRGRCVAFVGAGFSKVAGLPTWRELVTLLANAEELPKATREALEPMVRGNPPDHVLDEIAQRVSDGLPDKADFVPLLRRCLTASSEDPSAAERMKKRLSHLQGIPFKAILTLNFDDYLVGRRTSQDVYREVLRRDVDRWDHRFWKEGHGERGAPVVNLHGSLRDQYVVLTRRGYREQVHGDRAYLPFLRTMLGQYTVLYLGYSFTDPYLQELRSELLSLYGNQPSEPLAYAFREDVDPIRQQYWAEHEGIELITYSSENGHMGFDHLLKALYERTNPVAELARLLRNRRVLWLDKHPENNEVAREMLLQMVPSHLGPDSRVEIVEHRDVQAAIAALVAGHWDLVLTHWGENDAGPGKSNAEALLEGIRAKNVKVPIIVFSRAKHAAARRPVVISLGAQAYTGGHRELFAAIVRTLGEDRLTGP